jgi:hypothetical protein
MITIQSKLFAHHNLIPSIACIYAAISAFTDCVRINLCFRLKKSADTLRLMLYLVHKYKNYFYQPQKQEEKHTSGELFFQYAALYSKVYLCSNCAYKGVF